MSDPPPRTEGRRGRIAKACSQCRTAKTRCTFSEGSKRCDKCLQRGLECSMLPQGALVGQTSYKNHIESSYAADHSKQEGSKKEDVNGQGGVSPASTASSVAAAAAAAAAMDGVASPTGSYHSPSFIKHSPSMINSFSKAQRPSLESISPISAGSHYTSYMGDESPAYNGGSVSGVSSSGNECMRMESPTMSGNTLTSNADNAEGSLASFGIRETALSGNNVTMGDPGVNGSGESAADVASQLMEVNNGATGEGAVDASGEYFMNLGVFPEMLTKEMLQSRSHSPFNDPMLNSGINPLVPQIHTRFRFQNSAASMVLQSVDPVLLDKLGSPSRLLMPPRRVSARNVVNQRILSYRQVVRLFDFFKSNYNHWVSLPDAEPEELANYLLEQCPLLVTTCCCIALRFGSPDLWQTTYPSLVRYLTYELAQTLVSLPQNIECLQALTILAKYSDALSYGDFVFDMWYISGIGIQHLETIASLNDQFTYIHMRLWNHLVLARLASANTTGRNVLLDENALSMCRLVLNEGTSTKFDNCMVAEVLIQWELSKFLGGKITFSEFERAVADWQQEFGMLAQLPIIQFIEPVLLFCSFLARWTHSFRCYTASHSPPLSPQGDDSNLVAARNMSTQTLQEELTKLNVIINSLLTMVHVDYFACLSDTLLSIGFISAVMSRILIKIILARQEMMSIECKHQITTSASLVSQLAHRFSLTSRGQDVFQTRSVALTQLLKAGAYG